MDFSADTRGNFNNVDRDLYSDYSEISPWNPTYLNRFKRVSKPTWRYFSGTMPDFHRLLQGHDILLSFFAFWRSLSMWLGISNPFMGILMFIAICLGGGLYCVMYVLWAILWVGLWSWYIGVPVELIFNGLYPSQGVLLGYLVFSSNTSQEQNTQLTQLGLLIPLCLLTLLLFQALGSFFVKLMGVSPMFVAPAVVGFMFRAVKVHSTYLYVSPDPTFTEPSAVGPVHKSFFEFNDQGDPINGTQFGTDLYIGMSNLIFSSNWQPLIPLTIGLLVASPLSCLMAWVGAVSGAVSCILLSPLWSTVSAQFLIYPAAITMMSVAGFYFVFSVHSVLMGLVACFLTTMTSIAFNSFFEVFDQQTSSPLAAYFVIMILYLTGGSFPTLNHVELASLTTPEDHIRRYLLSRKIIHDMKIRSEMGRIDPLYFRNIEKSLLPILLCSYAKHGLIKSLQELLWLGADPNASDYDGRCALHIACSENREEIVYLLLKNQADLHKMDNFNNNALSSALLNSHYELAKYLWNKGGRLRLSRDKVSSILCYMVAYNDLERLKIWIDCGADPNSTDYDDRTPLHIAYSKKKDEIIKYLSKFAPRNEKLDRWGQKPSECYGKTVGDLKPVKETKRRGSDLRRAEDRHGSPQQTIRIDSQIIEAVIRQTLRSDDREKANALLPSLLCQLVFVNENKLLQNLIKENVIVDINVVDYDLRTPLHIACSTGDLDAVKTICWNNGNINAIDRFGNTPLLEACKAKHDTICEFLEEQGAQLCLSPEMQVSELCWAVFMNDFDMIQRLVRCGINIQVGDYDERTCLAVAYDNKNKNMMKLLREYIQYSTCSGSYSDSSDSGRADPPLQVTEKNLPEVKVNLEL